MFVPHFWELVRQRSVHWRRVAAPLLMVLTIFLGVGCQHVFGDFEIDKSLEQTSTGLCQSGELRCNEEYLLSCKEGEDGWQLKAACLAADRCDSRGGHCLICTPGDVRCNGAAREGCSADGSSWQLLETCADSTMCNPSFCGHCSNLGEVRCAAGPDSQGSTLLERCVANQGWQTIDTCQSEALCGLSVSAAMDNPQTWNNLCLAPGCPEPGALRCEGSTLQRCPQSLETWTELDVCDSAALCEKTMSDNSDPRAGMLLESCEAGCAPAGGFYCDGNELTRCRDDQTGYETLEACSEGLSCNSTLGACSGPCRPGEYRCNAARLELCDPQQEWTLVESCETAALCSASLDADSGVWSGACTPPVCGVDQHRCDGEVLLRCNDDRSDWVQEDVCASAALCEVENKRCRTPVCVAGARRCSPANPQELQECNDDQTGRDVVTTCPDDQACNPYPELGEECLGECPDNPVRCIGATRELCSDESGQPVWSFDATCASEDLCRCALNGTCDLAESGKCGAAVCGGTLPSFRCNGSLLERCAVGRDHWERSADCGSSDLCYAGAAGSAGTCLACPLAGEVRCYQSAGQEVRRTCSSDRSQWTSEQACSFGCVDNGTSDRCAVCFASELRCDQGGNLDICSAGRDALVDLLDCPYGCLPDDSGHMAECAACAEGESRCVSGNQRHTCNSNRRGLSLAETCAFSCLDQGLMDRCGECNEGDRQCVGDDLRVCEGRVYKPEESCDLACISGSGGADHCAADCVPGVSDCLDSATRRDCGASGSWNTPAETCSHACIDSGDRDFCAPDCAPGARRCTGTGASYQQCSAQGVWPSQSSACLSPTPVCLGDGTCVACDPAAYAPQCNGTTIRTCSMAGSLLDTPCSGICIAIDGVAGCHDCNPGAKRCQSGDVYTCSQAGAWPSTPSQACGGNGCNGTACAECAAGAEKCSTANDPSGEFSSCENGSWSSAEPCPAALGCANDEACKEPMGSGGMAGTSAAGSGGSSGQGGSGGAASP